MKIKRMSEKISNKRRCLKKYGILFLFCVIHFGICTCTSMIFEGNPRQGKKAEIEYSCQDLLDYEIENIIITKSFNLKDLFSKTIIKSTNNEKNSN